MKTHVDVYARSGFVPTAGVTTGKVHNAKVMDDLIREDDGAVYGDKGYAPNEKPDYPSSSEPRHKSLISFW
jgi:IS5 family transposase